MPLENQLEPLVKAICVFLLCAGVIVANRSSTGTRIGYYRKITGIAGCFIGSVCIISYYYSFMTLYFVMYVSLFF